MNRPSTWVELCCGSAAVTLRLLGGANAVPPVTYQGSKRKYAHAILAALGLRAGQGASRVVLCDAGPWAPVWQHLSAGVDLRPYMTAWNELDDEGQAEHFRVMRGELGGMPEPAKSAAWLWLLQRSFGGKGPAAGYCPRAIDHQPLSVMKGVPRYPADAPAPALGKLAAVPWPATTVHHGDIRDVEPIGDAAVYIDPDYQGVTGFAHGIPRADLLDLARRHADAGATVAISESVPLPLDGTTSRSPALARRHRATGRGSRASG